MKRIVVTCAVAASCVATTDAALAQQPTPPRDAFEEATPPADDAEWTLRHRRYSSVEGGTGGLRVSDPGGGEPGALRLQLVIDTAPADDFLETQSEVAQSRKSLSLSWTAMSLLEVYAGLRDRGTTSNRVETASLHAQSALVGFKLFGEVYRGLSLGGDLRFVLANNIGEQEPLLKATSIGLRGAAALDLRQLQGRLPLLLRLNLDYLFDNSALAVERVEQARYRSLDDPLPLGDDNRHLVTRVERYGLGVNRVDRLTPAIGIEAPLEVARETYLHPMLEWSLGMPINRQQYDCPLPAGGDDEDGALDSCTGEEGFSSWPMALTAGLRVVPPIRGVSLLASLDIALNDTSTFVRELAPSAPFMVSVGFSYDYDARPAEPAPRAASEPPASPRVARATPTAEAPAAEPPPMAAEPASVEAPPAPQATAPAAPAAVAPAPTAATTPSNDTAPTETAATAQSEAPAASDSAGGAPVPLTAP